MSLQVWLPLTKDLGNQGLGEITSSGTPVFKNIGKMGNKSLDLSSRVTFNCNSLSNLKTFSIAFWAKINSDTSLSTNWVDIISFADKKSDGSVSGLLRWESCYASGYTNWGISSHDNGSFNISNLGSFQATYKDIWHHITMTVDLENNAVKQYHNGILKLTSTCNGGYLAGNFHIGENNLINGEMNDLRIYDHALSPMEVKELSKGLVLHFPLSNNGVGGENLLGNTYDFSNIYNTNTGTQTIIIDSNDGIYLKSYPSSVDWSNIVFKPFFLASNISGKTITVSCDIRAYDLPSTNTSNYVYLTLQAYDTSTTNTRAGNRDYGIPSDFLKEGEWVRISYQRVVNFDDWAVGSGYTTNNFNYISLALFNHSGKRIDFRKAKVEIGDHPTPWCPNKNDTLYSSMGMNNGIEYDCSGFGNNGTRVGEFSWSTDTPRYLASTEFSGNSTCVRTSDNNWIARPIEEFTVNLWAYKDDWSTYGSQRLFSCTEGAGFNTEQISQSISFPINVYTSEERTSRQYTDSAYRPLIPLSSITSGWHMFTFTYSTSKISSYLDGELVDSKNYTSYGAFCGDNIPLCIGAEATSNFGTAGGHFVGKISDFKLFYTELDSTDILSLYQASAYIDSQGNTYASSYVEG